mgnify:CR=1 FL=1
MGDEVAYSLEDADKLKQARSKYGDLLEIIGKIDKSIEVSANWEGMASENFLDSLSNYKTNFATTIRKASDTCALMLSDLGELDNAENESAKAIGDTISA